MFAKYKSGIRTLRAVNEIISREKLFPESFTINTKEYFKTCTKYKYIPNATYNLVLSPTNDTTVYAYLQSSFITYDGHHYAMAKCYIKDIIFYFHST